ncbi:MAG: hypothetical protein WB987_08485 [Candidatus Acidiferrales bacterium]
MPTKWTDLAPWRQKQEAQAQDAPSGRTNVTPAPRTRSLEVAARSDKSKPNAASTSDAAPGSNAPASSQGDLLSVEDIYRTAGIMAPRMGYSIRKVADMLVSDHLRGLSDEMKRASVLIALDAAGIPVEEVLRDASLRQSAINSYESDQWKHFEDFWASKAAENAHIQSELERVTAQFQERIKRNLDEVAQEKIVFAGWQTMKQQEAQRIGEAAAICAKPSTAETFGDPQPVHRGLAVSARNV